MPLHHSESAARELGDAVKHLGLHGVEMCSKVNGKKLTDPSSVRQ